MTCDAVGGVWTYALDLGRALSRRGVETLFAVMGDAPSPAQEAAVRRIPGARLAMGRYPLEWMDDPWEGVDAAGAWLLEMAAEWRAGCVHLNGYCHGALPWGRPVLVAAHSCVLSWHRAVRGGAAPARYGEYRRRVEAGLRGANLVVAPSRAMLRALREHYRFSTRARVIPNGRDAAFLRPAAQKEALIFSAGRLWDEAKNLALLERIAPRLPWPVAVAGRGNPGAAVRALGVLEPGALAAWLGRAAIYAAPARYEPFGLGILEAGLCGCALVLGDIPSLREHWEGAALFAPPEDDGAWVGALGRLCSDAALRERLGSAAVKRASRHKVESAARVYFDSYAAFEE